MWNSAASDFAIRVVFVLGTPTSSYRRRPRNNLVGITLVPAFIARSRLSAPRVTALRLSAAGELSIEPVKVSFCNRNWTKDNQHAHAYASRGAAMRSLDHERCCVSAAVGFACLMSADARAAEQCKRSTCVTLTPTKTGSGWKVHIKVRTAAPDYEFFNVIVPGQSQLEVDGPGNNAEFDFDAPANWDGIVSAQACIGDRPVVSRCDPWATFNADFPKVTPALSAPDARFCDWYATEAVARAAQGAKCGFTGIRWSPDKQAQYGWCMQLKSQQQGWSEHNARVGLLADCLKKEVANTPPKANTSGRSKFCRMSIFTNCRAAWARRSAR